MASIFGIQLKGAKTFMGHEGPCIQGNVYKDGKKLGLWSEDSWGGEPFREFDESLCEEAVSAYKKIAPVGEEERKYISLDWLICDLYHLNRLHSGFKKARKKGYKTYVAANNSFKQMGYYDVCEKPEDTEYYRYFLGKCRTELGDDMVVKVYREDSDFDIA